jgi:exonuclease SbcC
VEARRERYRVNQAQLKALEGEQSTHDQALRQMGDDLREKPALVRQLAELQAALVQAGEAKDKIAGLVARRARWAASLEQDTAQRDKLEAEAGQHEALLRDASAKQRALDQLRQEDTLAKAQLGAAQQKLAALEGLAKQRDLKRADRNQLAEARGQHEELREAFGKKGVPAMMIEAAVPEIEAAANALLTRMTAGRMNVRFNTQRETQAGETRETLDIHISDELGTRAYELYSGGEAFRVNFAIRVALSQLLARRAGTQLQTLIVDEGFGVLDASGRERLVEAINAVQQDFQRILVVTHIDELKDAFPTRIEITKTPGGAEIAVV